MKECGSGGPVVGFIDVVFYDPFIELAEKIQSHLPIVQGKAQLIPAEVFYSAFQQLLLHGLQLSAGSGIDDGGVALPEIVANGNDYIEYNQAVGIVEFPEP